MKIQQSILASAMFALSSLSYAETDLFLEAGLHFGGDNLVTVSFVGGGNETIEAGGKLSGAIGFISDISESANLRTSLGIKFDAITAVNGDMSFYRFPLEVMVFTNSTEGFNFGAGMTYHIAPEFSADSLVLSGDVEFEDALGFVAEIDYMLSESAYLGLKLTSIDYETVLTAETVDGNSVGIVIGVSF